MKKLICKFIYKITFGKVCYGWGDCFVNYQKEFKKLHYHTAQMGKEEFIERIKTDDKFAKEWGDCNIKQKLNKVL